MTEEEKELLEAVRGAKDPVAAAMVAIEIIKDFLSQPLSLTEQEAENLLESA